MAIDPEVRARVAVMIFDADDDQRHADIRGRVVERIAGPQARDHIEKLAWRYNDTPFSKSRIRSERVIVRIAPHRQRVGHVGS